MGSRKNELIMNEAVIVSKDGNTLKTKINNYKTPIKVSPKIPTPSVIANSGLKNMSLIFSDKTQGYHMAFREMNYDVTEKQVVQSGIAYSLYFEITDDEDRTYLEGNIIPVESNKGILFLSVNVSPKNPENVDLFSLPIIIRYKGSFLSIVNDLSSVISNLKRDASKKRNRIYGKMLSLLEAFPKIYENNRNRLDVINNLETFPNIPIIIRHRQIETPDASLSYGNLSETAGMILDLSLFLFLFSLFFTIFP